MEFVTKVLLVLIGYVTLFYGVWAYHNDPHCGQSPYHRNSKIIGGEAVREAEFPWFVSIKETGRYECGGFIISQKAVLTAAHCFKHFAERVANAPKTITVTLAVHHLNHELKRRKRQLFTKWELDVKVRRIIRHPKYNVSSNSGKFDIALLLLEDKIEWNQATRPVCLPNNSVFHKSRSSHGEDFRNGEVAIVAGWPSDPKKYGAMLQKVKLTLYSSEECRRVLKERNVTMRMELDESMLCAGSKDMGIDSCTGDSGSALLIQRDNIWVAIGIVSSGLGPCGRGVPGLYTRISSYIDWIDLHNIDNIEPSLLFEKFQNFVPIKK